MTNRLFRISSAVMATGLVFGLAFSATAQTTSSKMEGLKLSNDAPIQIQSDQLEIKDQEKRAFFTGNVQVVQGTTTMKAGKMTVLYKGEGASVTSGSTDIDKIFLDDTVFLTSGTQQATAEKGDAVLAHVATQFIEMLRDLDNTSPEWLAQQPAVR